MINWKIVKFVALGILAFAAAILVLVYSIMTDETIRQREATYGLIGVLAVLGGTFFERAYRVYKKRWRGW